jgi:hypothetical protein
VRLAALAGEGVSGCIAVGITVGKQPAASLQSSVGSAEGAAGEGVDTTAVGATAVGEGSVAVGAQAERIIASRVARNMRDIDCIQPYLQNLFIRKYTLGGRSGARGRVCVGATYVSGNGAQRTAPMRIIGINDPHGRVRNGSHCRQCGRLTSRRSVMSIRRFHDPETIDHTRCACD